MTRLMTSVLFLIAAVAGGQTPEPLPLDLAFSRRTVPRSQRAVVSTDGRFVAYEIHKPPLITPETSGNVEPRFLPSGLPTSYLGTSLWISDTRTGTSRAVCAEAVTCWRGSWSPDSRVLAFYSDRDAQIGLWIHDTETEKTRRLGNSVIKAKLWPGDEAAWSNDGKTLFVPLRPDRVIDKPADMASAPAASVHGKPKVTVYRTHAAAQTTAGRDEATPKSMNDFYMAESNSTLAAVDAATGAVRIVVPFDAHPRPNHLRLSPDGRWLSYLSVYQKKQPTDSDNYQDLVVVPSAGGDPVAIFRDIRMATGDYAGTTYRWTNDSRSIVFSKNRDLWIADVAASGSTEPRQLAASMGKIAEVPLLLTAVGKAVVVAIEGDQGSLAVVPLDGSPPRTLGVSGSPVRSAYGKLWQPKAGTLYVIRDVKGAPQREVVEVNTQDGNSSRVWIEQGRFDIVGAAGDDALVSRFEGVATPPDLFLFNRRFEIVRRLSNAEPRLSALSVGPMDSFESVIPMHDGSLRSVRTHIFLPPGAKRGAKLPTIIYFYSGQAFARLAQDFGGGAPNSIPVQVFTSRGYAVLFCDVPLTPEGNTPGNPVKEMTDALLVQASHAAVLGFSDIRRLAIMGHSYGGYSAAAVITQTSVFRAAIALDGLYDLPGYYGRMTSAGVASFSWSETGQGRMGTHPWADLQRYLANSPYYQADKIRTPLLLIHGEKDGVCPVGEAEKMFNALQRLGREAELAVYAGEGHVPANWALVHTIDATERMLAFLEKHLAVK